VTRTWVPVVNSEEKASRQMMLAGGRSQEILEYSNRYLKYQGTLATVEVTPKSSREVTSQKKKSNATTYLYRSTIIKLVTHIYAETPNHLLLFLLKVDHQLLVVDNKLFAVGRPYSTRFAERTTTLFVNHEPLVVVDNKLFAVDNKSTH
jgi:hypothetical protein